MVCTIVQQLVYLSIKQFKITTLMTACLYIHVQSVSTITSFQSVPHTGNIFSLPKFSHVRYLTIIVRNISNNNNYTTSKTIQYSHIRTVIEYSQVH